MPPTSPSPALARIAERFSARLPARLDEMDTAAAAVAAGNETGALAELERILHDLAGTAPVLGYDELGALARSGEDMVVCIRVSATRPADESIEKLRAHLRRLRHVAKQERAEGQ
ncbi:hypothetical protein B2G71_21940 [Novosphingobium sp. PC22D]|nr:hypothetical protein B2G71_21940 [Novosphingobium sp. PC22D]